MYSLEAARTRLSPAMVPFLYRAIRAGSAVMMEQEINTDLGDWIVQHIEPNHHELSPIQPLIPYFVPLIEILPDHVVPEWGVSGTFPVTAPYGEELVEVQPLRFNEVALPIVSHFRPIEAVAVARPRPPAPMRGDDPFVFATRRGIEAKGVMGRHDQIIFGSLIAGFWNINQAEASLSNPSPEVEMYRGVDILYATARLREILATAAQVWDEQVSAVGQAFGAIAPELDPATRVALLIPWLTVPMRPIVAQAEAWAEPAMINLDNPWQAEREMQNVLGD